MELKLIGDKVENCKVTLFLRRALSSYYFPIVTAAVSLLSYYTGCDLLNIWYLSICGTAILICCKDVSPILCVALFFSLFPSPQHSPRFGSNSSDYLISPPVLAQEIICAVFLFGALIFRLINGIINRRFKITPMFWGIVTLSAAFMLGGAFYSGYTPLSFVYGLVFSVVLVGIYVFIYGNVQLTEKSVITIAYYFVALFVTAAIMLIVAYCTYDGLLANGVVNRGKLYFGWGTYNQMGLVLTMALPAWCYLASRYKQGIYFLLGGLLNLVMIFVSMSRQAILMGTFLFIACCVWLLIFDKGKKRVWNLCLMSGVVAALLIILGIYHEDVLKFFSQLALSFKTGSGRIKLWREGFENFLSAPLFGKGFYDPAALPGEVGYFSGKLAYIIPRMCHNTVFQILSGCGLAGLAAYLVHRVQTVLSFIDNITPERTFIAMTICAILLLSLLDNHIFYIMPAISYACLVAMLSSTEKREKKSKPLAISGLLN